MNGNPPKYGDLAPGPSPVPPPPPGFWNTIGQWIASWFPPVLPPLPPILPMKPKPRKPPQ